MAKLTFLILLYLNSFTHSLSKTTCIKSERQALLKFKQDLKDPSNMISIWGSDGDCCSWDRIVCDNVTSHITELHLGGSTGKALSYGMSKLGGKLNPALLELKSLSVLDLSNNDFEQSLIPDWFWNLTSHLHFLNISGNQFQGNIPYLITSHNSAVLDFSFNNFTGPIPSVSYNVIALDLSNNSMSGSITYFLCYTANQRTKLEVLNVRNNLLTGEIPDCWEKWPSLVALNFGNNNFSGRIPPSMGNLTSLRSLHLRDNSLVGEVPSSLSNCTKLLTLDFGGNRLSGEIPTWMGERLTKLTIISLQTNCFHGPIPEEICSLSSLRILDLSGNSLSGSIPRCISNLSAMASRNDSDAKIAYNYNTPEGSFSEYIELVMKGIIYDYKSSILKFLYLVDLSSNNLWGQIPEGMASLVGLKSLNLSNNHLVGRIPDSFGAMTNLECLDLSINNLSGEIPKGMSGLNFLSHLNLSCNKLTGKIPSGGQFDTFDKSSFLGNKLHEPTLHGSRKPEVVAPTPANGLDLSRVNWLYLNMEFGFVFGLSSVALPVLYSKRYDYFIFSRWFKLREKLRRSSKKYVVPPLKRSTRQAGPGG